MKMSTFPLLDQLFDAECNATRVKDPNEFLLLRLERLGDRLDELAYTAFVQAEEYLNELLGDSVECYVERNTDTDLGGAPSMGFRWGVQGQRLHSLSLAAHVDSGSIHATWSCWRNGTPFHGDCAITAVWTGAHVHEMLQELLFNFPPIATVAASETGRSWVPRFVG